MFGASFRLRAASALLCLGLLGAAAAGCRKKADERCQVASDCEQGLICELTGNMVSMGGICQVPFDLGPGPKDMTVVPDLAGDASAPGDAGAPSDGHAADSGG